MDWKHKLGSRKFWALVAAFITALLVLFGVDSVTIEKVVALIAAAGTAVAYILVEGNIDAKSANNTLHIDSYNDTNEFDDL